MEREREREGQKDECKMERERGGDKDMEKMLR